MSTVMGAVDAADATITPNATNHEGLAALASRYVDVASLPWEATRFPGIQVKTLLKNDQTGLLTTLVKMDPGAVLPDHEHVEIEQTWVLEGALIDDEGAAEAGSFVWRPAGSRHGARAPDGALLVGFFLKPNRFFDIEEAPRGFDPVR
ncbi:MAG: cupin domain-containing protein [Gammaproteobacteria bacterium]